MKRIVSALLVCATVLWNAGWTSAAAYRSTATPLSELTCEAVSEVIIPTEWDASTRATHLLELRVSANAVAGASSPLSLTEGETVTVDANYRPASANVDFGLLSSDGIFYYNSHSGGEIQDTILVDVQGTYVLAIRNNSSSAINVSGFVSY